MTLKRLVEVVLLRDFPTLGQKGSLVRVKPGYARHYLYPAGVVKYATDANILAHSAPIFKQKNTNPPQSVLRQKRIASGGAIIEKPTKIKQ